MNTVMKYLTTKMCNAIILSIVVLSGGNAIAQESYKIHREARTNLGLDLTYEHNRGYAFIKQIFDRDREIPFLTVSLRSSPLGETVDNWTWEVAHPSDNQIKNQLTFKWYGQASCPGDLTHLSINGPGGNKVQNPLSNPVAGYFSYQSFDHENIKNVCTNWATANNCDPIEPGCQIYEEFNLVGGAAPVAGDTLHLSAMCANGTTINKPYAPVMTLRCDRSGLW